ncbi:hypothetical protein GCM10008090_23420 [Arenicella chitinivorans]|uniref:Uncharacterized protein n=1 Tax=Arenicella chitinivorans TaxID=1329800 RepID=A0A918RU53_9GAMM|nr:hypothetical protein [Arenicella chitinivorans]GHA13036.1 hypothetical protein GCM10008090_23420 [Arenicella chitinivorans]
MFKQFFRLAFVTVIWKQYKQVIVSTLLLFIYIFLVSNIHADFLTHTEMQKDTTGTGLSFIAKWLAYALGVGMYFAYHAFRGRDKKSKSSKKSKHKVSTNPSVIDVDKESDENDPFAEIRKRKTLRSRADFLEGKD